jgi:hypothetical protein
VMDAGSDRGICTAEERLTQRYVCLSRTRKTASQDHDVGENPTLGKDWNHVQPSLVAQYFLAEGHKVKKITCNAGQSGRYGPAHGTGVKTGGLAWHQQLDTMRGQIPGQTVQSSATLRLSI